MQLQLRSISSSPSASSCSSAPTTIFTSQQASDTPYNVVSNASAQKSLHGNDLAPFQHQKHQISHQPGWLAGPTDSPGPAIYVPAEIQRFGANYLSNQSSQSADYSATAPGSRRSSIAVSYGAEVYEGAQSPTNSPTNSRLRTSIAGSRARSFHGSFRGSK